MRNLRKVVAAGTVCAAVFVCANGDWARLSAQTSKKHETVSKSLEGPHRVPAHYAKVGLTSAQREKIYAVQAKHHERIQSLTKQLEEEHARVSSECEAVLTPEQRKQLDQLRHSGGGNQTAAEPEPTPTKGETKREPTENIKKKGASSKKRREIEK